MAPDTPIPAFPCDLEREIFEIAAYSRPLSIPTFAWRAKLWFATKHLFVPLLEPLLYRTIVLSADGGSSAIPSVIPDHPTIHRDCLIQLIQSGSALPREAIENLWFLSGDGEEASQITEGLSLTHLYCHLDDLFDGIDLGIWGGLALIPHLTHLCSDDKAFLPLCLTLLHTCISLRVLVVLDASLVVHLEEPPLVNDEPALLKDPRTGKWERTRGAITGRARKILLRGEGRRNSIRFNV
ncbi:hypothetical protein DFH09DRAFT_1089447 [Mycena vulgaris]|nr:hypothetical protein DFH09DRAFT_1089447 [Mycena vulgaris]